MFLGISSSYSTKIINDNLCLFTNESKDYGKDNFLVHFAKIDFSKEYQSEYEKSYSKTDLPISEKNCIAIPLDKLEKNLAYTITLIKVITPIKIKTKNRILKKILQFRLLLLVASFVNIPEVFAEHHESVLDTGDTAWIIRLNQVQDQDPCAPDVVHIIKSQIIPSLGLGSRAERDLAYYQVAD